MAPITLYPPPSSFFFSLTQLAHARKQKVIKDRFIKHVIHCDMKSCKKQVLHVDQKLNLENM